jgi:hypothetical protein
VLQTLGANVERRRVVKATRKAANKVTKLVSSENGQDQSRRLRRQASDKGKTLQISNGCGNKRSSDAVKKAWNQEKPGLDEPTRKRAKKAGK